MNNTFQAFLAFMLLMGCLTYSLRSQEVLQSDAHIVYPSEITKTKIQTRANSVLDTLSFSASQPFFDDFSQESQMLDSTKWFLGQGNFPAITRTFAIGPPSLGVATFDGGWPDGTPYEINSLRTGIADELLSQSINLAFLNVTAGIKLSFFLQAKGLGEAPEATDKFEVYFKNSQEEFVQVASFSGDISQQFSQHIISVDNPSFFHAGFQILFRSVGSLNGSLDHWHLDYVYMAPGRNADNASTTYNDVALVSTTNPLLVPYSAVPLSQYQRGMGSTFEVGLTTNNLFPGIISTQIEANILDPTGGNVFSGTDVYNSTQNLGANASNFISLPRLSKQNFTSEGAYQLRITSTTSGDWQRRNDTLSYTFPIDSVLAFDDGEANASYGLSQTRGFGLRVDLIAPDTLTAVWMSFVPLLNFNPNTNKTSYMQGKAFRLAVWDDPHPDSVIFRQVDGMRVTYGETPNTYFRFPLSTPVPVDGTFWVGIQQLESEPIGLGLDLNYENPSLMYWDSVGTWTRTGIRGSFMIRPELNGKSLITSLANLVQSQEMNIYPNPVIGGNRAITISFIKANPKIEKITLLDIQGRLIYLKNIKKINSGAISFPLPSFIEPGIYFLRIGHKGGLVSIKKLTIYD